MDIVRKIKKSKNILGKRVKIVFLKRIRKEKKFSSIDSLTAGIKKDIELVTA